jgi:hypothetical protein
MKKIFLAATMFLLVGFGCTQNENGKIVSPNPGGEAETTRDNSLSVPQQPMKLTSSAFGDGGKLPSKYSCDGEEINPPLQISDVPVDAKSLAFIMDDPDTPDGIFTHWIMWNLNSQLKEIQENSVPAGATEGTTSIETSGYVGACPPSGMHRYMFKLFALDTTLDLSETTTSEQLQKAMEGHVLEQAVLMATYTR